MINHDEMTGHDEMKERTKRAARHLCEAIAIRTVSDPDEEKTDWAEFGRFHDWLEKTYPVTHKTLARETVSGASLLYKWTGSKTGGKTGGNTGGKPSGKTDSKTGSKTGSKPFGLLAHMDVVPIEEGTEKDWTHPPFEGFADEDTVWGRGASDMKNQVVALFETIETLLLEGFAPDCDIYLCVGHNEEVQVGENSGARAIAKLLHERGVMMEFVLDEGGAIIEDPPFGIKTPAAMIGLAEKGYADFRVSVAGEGGHAAEPPKHTALGKLAKALAAIEAAPMKQRLVPPVTFTFEAFSKHMNAPLRAAMANLWLTKPLVLWFLSKDLQTNAMTRSTIAATMAEASPVVNVLPQRASAMLNVRILPGDAVEDVRGHILKTCAKAGVNAEVDIVKVSPPIGMRPSVWAYQAIQNCLSAISDGILPIPYLVTGATDSREYASVADEIYRFYPFVLSGRELAAMHATDERIRFESLAGALRFNYSFIKEAGTRT